MDEQAYARMAEVAGRHWWFVGRRAIVAQELRRLGLPPGSRILEAGCGPGANLAMLARFGQVSAFEPYEGALALAQGLGLADVRPGTLPGDIPFAAGSFDAVLALDVLEHVDDDVGSAAALAALLKPGGALVVTVPAFPFLWSAHDEMLHHRRRYRRAELLGRIGAAGLHVVRATYFNTLLFPAVAGVRLARRLVTLPVATDDALPPPWLNALLGGIFSLERRWLAAAPLPLGVSLLAVARREAS